MDWKKHTTLIILLIVGFVIGGFAQEAVQSSGGNAEGSGGNASYSVGGIAYSAYSSAEGSVTEGVQQPYEVSIITALEHAKDISLIFSVHPNPTTDVLVLNISDIDVKNYRYQLFDSNGRLIESGNIIEKEHTISMRNLVSAAYILKVNRMQQEQKVFKIIKH